MQVSLPTHDAHDGKMNRRAIKEIFFLHFYCTPYYKNPQFSYWDPKPRLWLAICVRAQKVTNSMPRPKVQKTPSPNEKGINYTIYDTSVTNSISLARYELYTVV